MLTSSLKDAKAGFSNLVDEAVRGEFVMIARHDKLAAALVSIEAADIARKAMEKKRPGLVGYLRTLPGDSFEYSHLCAVTCWIPTSIQMLSPSRVKASPVTGQSTSTLLMRVASGSMGSGTHRPISCCPFGLCL